MVLQFGPFTLDPQKRLLLKSGSAVTLGPKVVETLCVLIEHRGELVTKDELMNRLWPTQYVGENNLSPKHLSIEAHTRQRWITRCYCDDGVPWLLFRRASHSTKRSTDLRTAARRPATDARYQGDSLARGGIAGCVCFDAIGTKHITAEKCFGVRAADSRVTAPLQTWTVPLESAIE